MKQNNKLRITFSSWQSFKATTIKELEQYKKTGELITGDEPDVLTFDTIQSYQKLMGEQKYVLLAVIRTLHPKSTYELAQLVSRDFANVKRDCTALESAGFIKMVDVHDKRKTKKPELVFDYSVIEVQLPNITYSHWIGDITSEALRA